MAISIPQKPRANRLLSALRNSTRRLSIYTSTSRMWRRSAATPAVISQSLRRPPCFIAYSDIHASPQRLVVEGWLPLLVHHRKHVRELEQEHSFRQRVSRFPEVCMQALTASTAVSTSPTSSPSSMPSNLPSWRPLSPSSSAGGRSPNDDWSRSHSRTLNELCYA
jgi:hypothetical protein